MRNQQGEPTMSYDVRDFEMPEISPMVGVFVAGLLVGGLVGALSMLLGAPQSGERTRKQIRRKAMALREQVSDNAEEALEKAEDSLDEALGRVRKLRHTAMDRVDEVQQRGQEIVGERVDRVKAVVDAGKGLVRRPANHH
jgi:gas vesicle protein